MNYCVQEAFISLHSHFPNFHISVGCFVCCLFLTTSSFNLYLTTSILVAFMHGPQPHNSLSSSGPLVYIRCANNPVSTQSANISLRPAEPTSNKHVDQFAQESESLTVAQRFSPRQMSRPDSHLWPATVAWSPSSHTALHGRTRRSPQRAQSRPTQHQH